MLQIATHETEEALPLSYEKEPFYWWMTPVPPMKDMDFELHPCGDVMLQSRAFGPEEEINGFEFGPGLIAWRPVGLTQDISHEFDGRRYISHFDHRALCGWRCFGFEPILVVKNTATGDSWLFVYRKEFERWCRMVPIFGECPLTFTWPQTKRVFSLLVLAAVLVPLYVVSTVTTLSTMAALLTR